MLTRNHTADVLKGITIILMVQVHILELFAVNEISESRIGHILMFFGRPAVAPIFMVILGYFIASTNKITKQLIGRGLKIFALGMLLNLALNFNLIYSAFRGNIEATIWTYIFGVDILQFAGLSLISIALLKNLFEKNLFLLLLVINLIAFLGDILLNYVPENILLQYLSAFIYGSVSWSYFPLFPWLAYPLVGLALHQIQKRYDLSFFYLPKTKLINGILFLLFLD